MQQRSLARRQADVDRSNSPSAIRQVELAHAFYLIKLVEFMDTFIFVLRKKRSQITFLHVFHHFAVPLSLWFGIKVVPGGHGAFFATVNSFVHVVMYFYYGIAALGPDYTPWLWWKPWVTRLQLLQFVALYFHSAQLLFHNPCGYPILFAQCINAYSLVFFVLFLDYYYKANRKSKEVATVELAVFGAPKNLKSE